MWKSVQTPVITVASIFLFLFLYTKLLGPIPFSVNSVTTTKASLFTVQASADATGVPDTAQVSVGVNKTAPTVQEAQNQVNEVINRITGDLKNLGLSEKDIKTTNYSVNPNYDFNSGSQKINGYVVNAQVQVSLKSVDQANQAVDLATQAGATDVSNVQFVLNEEKKLAVEDQARKEAIEKAKKKAESIAKASGIRLGRLVDVQETGAVDQPRPMEYQTANLKVSADAAAPATQLNPGENKITSNVTLSYETH